jgi:hypothetical protein
MQVFVYGKNSMALLLLLEVNSRSGNNKDSLPFQNGKESFQRNLYLGG